LVVLLDLLRTAGLSLASPTGLAVWHLAIGVENLEWVLTEDTTGTQEVSSVIAMVDILSLPLLHLLVLTLSNKLTSAGSVAVAGKFHMVMVDRML
jgi:hypothetical protein